MKQSRIILAGVTIACVLILYLPMLAVAILSLNQSRLGFVWQGFTFDWYQRLLANDLLLSAVRNTIVLAIVSTVVSTILGTGLALGMMRAPWPRWLTRLFETTLFLPVVMPDIIFAAALVVAFRVLGAIFARFQLGLTTMIIGHITFQISIVAMIVRARLVLLGPSIEEAARDLYADSFYLLRKIMLPLLLPAICAGALLALTLSLDDFVISFFTSGPDSTTLPLYIYSSVKRGLSPELHAISTVMFLAAMLLVVGGQFIFRRPLAKGTP